MLMDLSLYPPQVGSHYQFQFLTISEKPKKKKTLYFTLGCFQPLYVFWILVIVNLAKIMAKQNKLSLIIITRHD